MNATVTIALATAAFGAAAWAGTRAADALCARRVAFADGPQPVHVPRWAFVLAGACAGAAIAAHGASMPSLAVLAVVTGALAGGSAADFRLGLLPDAFTLGPLALVVALGLVRRDAMPAVGATILFAAFALAAIVSRGRGMGWGDVKLAALGGALLGARDATVAVMLAACAAYAIARRGGATRRPVAFGPYLAASIAATLAAGIP